MDRTLIVCHCFPMGLEDAVRRAQERKDARPPQPKPVRPAEEKEAAVRHRADAARQASARADRDRRLEDVRSHARRAGIYAVLTDPLVTSYFGAKTPRETENSLHGLDLSHFTEKKVGTRVDTITDGDGGSYSIVVDDMEQRSLRVGVAVVGNELWITVDRYPDVMVRRSSKFDLRDDSCHPRIHRYVETAVGEYLSGVGVRVGRRVEPQPSQKVSTGHSPGPSPGPRITIFVTIVFCAAIIFVLTLLIAMN